MFRIVLLLGVLVTCFTSHDISEKVDDDSSKIPFEHAYPKHLRAKKISNEEIVINGKLDEVAWSTAHWVDTFVDIIKHKDGRLDSVPREFQSQVAVLWNDSYLFIGAKMREPFIFGKIQGHNLQAPYHDNDFEVFIDVSGTNYYYKEFEINVLNATYDVNWGVPDNANLNCDSSIDRKDVYLPVCVNTSFPGYAGNWTMFRQDGGLQTGTNYEKDSFGKYTSYNEWTVEIAFPIVRSRFHGGLLDTDSNSDRYDKYHPKHASSSRLPYYWWIDFARAEHPRQYTSGEENIFCPFNCYQNLTSYKVSKDNPTAPQCTFLQKEYPTLLGEDPIYGCYFEWVLQDLGRGDAYMHRPLEWAILEFTDADTSCRNIEFIGRHALKVIYYAQVEYKRVNNMYTNELDVLTNRKYCTFEQDCKDLETVRERHDIFKIVQISVIENATVLNEECTSRPCFMVKVHILLPEVSNDSVLYVASINENMHVIINHSVDFTHKASEKICLK